MKKKITIFLALVMILSMFSSFSTVFGNPNDVDVLSSATKPSGVVWKYYDKEENPLKTDHPEEWAIGKFKPGIALKEGTGPFGAKNGQQSHDGYKTVLNQYKANSDNIETFFFLRDWKVSNVSEYEGGAMKFNIAYDDAVIVYLNGQKVYEGNVPNGGYPNIISYGSASAAGRYEDDYVTIPWEKIKDDIKEENVVAVELHQHDANSSDLYFNMNSLRLVKKPGAPSDEDKWKYYDLEENPLKDLEPEKWSVGEFKNGIVLKEGIPPFGARKGKAYNKNGLQSKTTLHQYKSNGKNIETYFFLKEWKLAKKDFYEGSEMSFDLTYDDAAIVYLNGYNIYEVNVPNGGYSEIISYGSEDSIGTPKTVNVNLSWDEIKDYIQEDNKIAVELHQRSKSSSDIYFDFQNLKLPPTKTVIPLDGEEWAYSDVNKDLGKTDDRYSWTRGDFAPSIDITKDIKTNIGPFGAKRGEAYPLDEDTSKTTLSQYIGTTDENVPTFFFIKDMTLDKNSFTGKIAEVSLKVDDGAIVYINGQKVMEANTPSGGYSSNMDYGADDAHGKPRTYKKKINGEDFKAFLNDGVNRIAVEVHQSSASSSDVYFGKFAITVKEPEVPDIWDYSDVSKDLGKSGNKTSWTTRDFADTIDVNTDLKSALGPFGHSKGKKYKLGEDTTKTTVNRYIPGTDDNIPTYFFLKDFDLKRADFVNKDLKISFKCDDAAIVYINGHEVMRANTPPNGYATNMEYGSIKAHKRPDYYEAVIPGEDLQDYLTTGKATIAVEVHQSSRSSSDVYFGKFKAEKVDRPTIDHSYMNPVLTIGSDPSIRNFTWYSYSRENGNFEIAEANDGKDFTNAVLVDNIVGQKNNTGRYRNYQTTISNLKPSTKYMYRFWNGTEEKSEVYTFTTGSPGGYTFLAVGDPQLGSSESLTNDVAGWTRTLEVMTEHNQNPDFILSLGDQVEHDGNEEEYTGVLNHKEIPQHTFVPVIGNHDTANHAFSEHFYLPMQIPGEGETAAGSNYYFVYNNTLFIMLNSNSTNTSEHEKTIKDAIDSINGRDDIKWKVVTFHHSIYSVASHSKSDSILRRREELSPLMKKYGIDVVLLGHDHSYTRTHIMDGTTPIVKWENDQVGVAPTLYKDPAGIPYITLSSSSGSKFYTVKSDNFDYVAVQSTNDGDDKIPFFSNAEVTDHRFKLSTYKFNTKDLANKEYTLYDEIIIEKSSPITITSVAPVQDVAVEYGTDVNTITLPEKVTLQLSDGTTKDAP
ncbi:MAG: metallophosphoesterase family protein, partial [Tissierellia bacterium]|nr:metallophosphoesterase family protein [Tissierellia bacterium]